MGKRKKKNQNEISPDGNSKSIEAGDSSNNTTEHDGGMNDSISSAQGFKEDGNRFFQKKDYKGAMQKYEKAIRLLPRNHIELPNIHANMASCYMQLGLSEYPKAIHECNLALNLMPTCLKALLKRAKCYEALNKLDLAFNDVCSVLKMEPNNPTAVEISERVKKTLESKGLRVTDTVIELPPDYVEPPSYFPALQVVEDMVRKKKGNNKTDHEVGDIDRKMGDNTVAKSETKMIDEEGENQIKGIVETKKFEVKRDQDEAVAVEASQVKPVEEPKRTIKLVFGEDIRWAELPLRCSVIQLREVVHDQFPSLKAVHVKYMDHEGDLVTITTDEELQLAEASVRTHEIKKFYIVEVSPLKDPYFGRFVEIKKLKMVTSMSRFKETTDGSCNIEDWMFEFARLFENRIKLESDNLLELGMKVNAEAMEETVTSEEAQCLFDTAAEKFKEMAALSMLNLGNVHMCRARKVMKLCKGTSKEEHVTQLNQITAACRCAQEEYLKANGMYQEALRINPGLYEAFLAIAIQQAEEAKLLWYHALGSQADLVTWRYTDSFQLYENAEANVEKSMELCELSIQKKVTNGSLAANIRSLMNILWATVLFEKSIMECKLGLPAWQDHLEAAVEKHELAGASSKDVAIMIKNHCSNSYAFDVLKISGVILLADEIEQTCNEICAAKEWKTGVPLDHLEQILQKRVTKVFNFPKV